MNNQLSPDEKRWYALHVRSRHEKLVHGLIQAKNLEAYLPVKKILRKWSDRKKIVEFPVFNGYIFVHIQLSDKETVLNTKGVIRLLGKYAPECIPDEQIETLKIFEAHDIEVDPYLNLHEGGMIKVKNGPFKDCTGFLVRKKTKHRLLVNLDVINSAVSVEIDASDVGEA